MYPNLGDAVAAAQAGSAAGVATLAAGLQVMMLMAALPSVVPQEPQPSSAVASVLAFMVSGILPPTLLVLVVAVAPRERLTRVCINNERGVFRCASTPPTRCSHSSERVSVPAFPRFIPR